MNSVLILILINTDVYTGDIMYSRRGLTESPVRKKTIIEGKSKYQHSSQSHHSLPLHRHGDPQKFLFLSTIKEPINRMSKQPNMPTKMQAKKAYRHQSQAKAPQESIYPNDQGIRRNPKSPSPRQHPHPSRLGATFQVMKVPHTSAGRANQ